MSDWRQLLAQVRARNGELTGAGAIEMRPAWRAAAYRAAAGEPEPVVSPGPAPGGRAHLTEPWFCCAEPTQQQLAGVAAAPVAFDACPSPMTRTNG